MIEPNGELESSSGEATAVEPAVVTEEKKAPARRGRKPRAAKVATDDPAIDAGTVHEGTELDSGTGKPASETATPPRRRSRAAKTAEGEGAGIPDAAASDTATPRSKDAEAATAKKVPARRGRKPAARNPEGVESAVEAPGAAALEPATGDSADQTAKPVRKRRARTVDPASVAVASAEHDAGKTDVFDQALPNPDAGSNPQSRIEPSVPVAAEAIDGSDAAGSRDETPKAAEGRTTRRPRRTAQTEGDASQVEAASPSAEPVARESASQAFARSDQHPAQYRTRERRDTPTLDGSRGQGGSGTRYQRNQSNQHNNHTGTNGQGNQSGQGAQGPQGSQNGQGNAGNRNQRRNKRRGAEVVEPKVNREELSALKVAELRAKAAELGLDTKVVTRKDQLVDAIYEASLVAEGFSPVTGLLDIMSEGYGFIRTSGYFPGEHDAYVGANLIRRCGLRKGDWISGRLRPLRENDKYPAVHKVETVNGKSVDETRNRPKFSDLTPVYPDERLVMEHGKDFITARTIDLVAPIGKGQRGLIVSPPKAGKTTILKDIAASIADNNPDVHLMCLLVDERPEEVTDMQRSIKGEVIASTFDMPSENHITVSELVIERAKRLVEMGQDVVILLDSITRLARAYNLAQPASGRILSGGVDSTALYPPKRFLGAARNIEHGGSLTILASALIETGSKMDEVIFEEFKGTGNMELKLDRSLADRRIFPAIDPISSGTRKEELLLESQSAPFIWGMRRILAGMNNTERAMEMLVKSLRKTESNQEFLIRTARKANEKSAQTLEL